MKLKYTILTLLALLLTSCSTPKQQNLTASKKTFKLQIIHMNDTHSHIQPTKLAISIDGKKTYVYAGGYAKIGKFIKDKKVAYHNTLVLHAGDALQGTLYFTLFKGVADVAILNHMDIDAMTLGNHEFDNGAYDFAKYFANNANFAIVSCDINATSNKELKNTIKPFIIKDFNTEKVAIVGDSIDSSIISSPGPTIKFLNYINSAKKTVKRLERMKINKIIFLTHIGYDKDKILASQVNDIDIIAGGHSHTLLGNFKNIGLSSRGNYPTIVESNNSKTLIVTAWEWGKVVGDLTVLFNDKGNIIDYKGYPIMLLNDKFIRKNSKGEKKEVDKKEKKKIEKFISDSSDLMIQIPDKTILKIINRYKPKVAKLKNNTIAKASINFIHVRLPGEKYEQSGAILPQGSMVAPQIALSIYKKAKIVGGCDFSLLNAGGIRAALPKGEITIGKIINILPFGNTLIVLELKGSDIKTMLENAIDRSYIKRVNTGAFPYLGNAKITIDISKPIGQRVVSFKIKKDGKWVDINADKTYKIATSKYISSGGDYYKEMKSAINKYDTGYILSNIFINYLKKIKVLKPLKKEDIPIRIIK